MPKAKDIPPCPTVPHRAPTVVRDFRIELITPLFGGGAEPKSIDIGNVIRPTGLRGQLQFWWRATSGSSFTSLDELRNEHSRIWGSTERASQVRIKVGKVVASPPTPCASFQWDDGARHGQGRWRLNWQAPFDSNAHSLPYAIFPFQGELPRANPDAGILNPPSMCIVQASFNLIIECPDNLWESVEPALWALTNFGGLGSRTRRGCGALYCESFAPADSAHLASTLGAYEANKFLIREWPTLGGSLLLNESFSSKAPIAAWNKTIECLQHFRQGVGQGRNFGTAANRPGRSRFPEPESIRKIMKTRSRKHQRLDQIPDDAFPRAEFGLPIVFHFKDERAGDPPDTVLYPSNDADNNRRERMASPLVLRPIKFSSGLTMPMVMKLNTPQLDGVQLRRGDDVLKATSELVVRDRSLATYPNSPISGSHNGSAVEAFLDFIKSRGFKEVTQ